MYVLVQKPMVKLLVTALHHTGWYSHCQHSGNRLLLGSELSVSHSQTHMHPFSFIPTVSKNRFFLLFRAIYLLVLFIWSLPISFKTLLHQLHALPFHCHFLHRSYTGSSPSHWRKKIFKVSMYFSLIQYSPLIAILLFFLASSSKKLHTYLYFLILLPTS